jgi:AraC-like DNA-binding protein
MKPQFDFFSLVNLFGAVNGIFFAVVFLKIKKGNRKAGRLAALLLLNMAVIAAGSFYISSGSLTLYPKLQKVFSPFLFFLGPLLFFYVRSLVNGKIRFGLMSAAYFGPALLNVLYNVPFYLKSDTEKVAMLALGLTPAVRAIRVLAFIHFSSFLPFILRDIRRFRAAAEDQVASLSRMKLRWIAALGFSVGTILLVNIAPERPIPVFFELAKIWEALLILILGYKGLTQPALFGAPEARVDPGKSEQPLVPENRLGEYAKRISEFMDGEKPFLDPELSMSAFAERLGIPPNYCSFVINRHWKTNFFNFVNRYRIEEFKRRLSRDDHSGTILETALEVGFNSKSTFNAVFKQFEGVTPSQYRVRKAPRTSDFPKN